MERGAPEITGDAVDLLRAVGAIPKEEPMVALGTRDCAEAKRDEGDMVAEPHQRVGDLLDAAAARRAIVVHAGHDDDFALA